MDKWQAIHSFFEYSDIPVYEENSVPSDATYPRITYEARTGSIDDVVTISASVWDKNTSWESVDLIVNALENRIDTYGCPIIDGGRYRVYKGSPFAQRMGEPDNDLIRRCMLQINFEFMTQ